MSMVAPQPSGMKVWCDSVYEVGIGKTKGTFDPIDSNQATIKIQKPDAASILGFLIAYTAAVVTDGENTPNAIVMVTSKALGISEEEIVVANGGPQANATNDWAPLITKYVPFRTDKPEKLFNAELKFTVTPSVSTTGGIDIVVGVIYSNAEPDSQFAIELMAQMTKRALGGVAKADAAKAHTGLAASTLTALPIPTGPRTLLGILCNIEPEGIAADDPIAGVMEFSTSGIPDFSPQIWPLSTSWNPCLGTVVAENAQGNNGRYYPTRFPLTGAAVDVVVKSTILVTAAGAPNTTQALLYE